AVRPPRSRRREIGSRSAGCRARSGPSSYSPVRFASRLPCRPCYRATHQASCLCAGNKNPLLFRELRLIRPERRFLRSEARPSSSQHLLETQPRGRTIEIRSIHAAIPLIAALANVVIWVATLSQGVSQRVIRIFSVLCLCVASWNLGMFSLYH